MSSPFSLLPEAHGMFDPAFERDSCGLAMVATLTEPVSHRIVALALEALRNLEHRGATGADEGTGDGAGITTQIPDAFFRAVSTFELPAAGHYAVGTAFLPVDAAARAEAKRGIEELAADEDLEVLGWREVPVDASAIGTSARAVMPAFEQLFVTSIRGVRAEAFGIVLDRQTFRLRKRAERELDAYFPSLSSRTIVYKGMVTTLQLEPFYPDLSDERFASKLAIVHSRYSTNTFPSWQLAQPMRFVAHNGEINTVQGNRNWMRARQSQLHSELLGDLRPLFPIVSPGASDSAAFDEVVELLTLAGRSLPHAITMMIPEAYERQAGIDPARRDYYEYHSMLMEPWDGPAAMVFTDGTLVGATLDRNGLRPGRFLVTDDGLVVLASEIGVLDLDPATIVRKGRLQPGTLFLVDVEAGRIIEDDEVKDSLAAQKPWGVWLGANRINLENLPDREHILHTPASVSRRQRTFGYTHEEVRILIAPMAQYAIEPIGAMGSDTPIAVLSDRPRLLFDYFTQQFAQVTNPPLDSIREDIVTSMSLGIGPERNLLDATPQHAAQVVLDFPVLDNDELAKIQHLGSTPGSTSRGSTSQGSATTTTIRGTYRTADGAESLPRRLAAMCAEVDSAIENGAQFIVLSDRESNAEFAPVPSLLMVAAVHHHLIRTENRLKVGLIVEAGDVREVHHVALLIGYGASGVNPYLAMETAEQLVRSREITGVDETEAVRNIIKALGKGVLKIMSKMGISVASSYSGAQAFEAVGLDKRFVNAYFTGTTSRLGGVGIDVIAAENLARHRSAYPDESAVVAHRRLDTGGEYQWRREGPPHLFNPDAVFRLQHSTRTRRFDIFREYTKLVDDQSASLMTLRGMFTFAEGARAPVPIDEVEPISDIVKRFSTGAMSLGSISPEAHETLAIAMNRLGARSNTGEGGEDVERLLDPARRSAIKQVASARFGVTSMYLTHASDIQIKMAQGAKPGEGGQLPSTKVYPWIARTRHSTAGVGLISPPPHHDIYSIEDLKQLIYDIKRASPDARVHVKLVSASGIGAVAAGVTKALADVILVSGHDGGTGASPLNSLKHAGTPWELGLAETQHTLLTNGLRDRVVVQVDGQLKTGRDVIVAALLGAEEFGFATAPLVVSGCVMMRVCHLDTCPVGVATQNPELRARFTGKPEFVETFFEFLAQEVREYLAQLGFRTLDEAIGRSELLSVDSAVSHWKTEGLNLDPVLAAPRVAAGVSLRNTRGQDHKLDEHFDVNLVALSSDALAAPTPASTLPVVIELPIRNTDRAVGTMLGHEVTKRFGEAGLPLDTIDVTLHGTAGQSLGAFLPAGITLRLEGDANDYVGKGLSGGRIVVRPDRRSRAVAERNIIAGNVIGYGATSGSLFIRGAVGERFMVRNSGAEAVVEGVGDHALEYMTGGIVAILGPTGRNLGAGMSGGVAYVRRLRPDRVNQHALGSGELTLLTLDEADHAVLRRLLTTHRDLTDSTVAKALLADFTAVTDEFVKLVPRDFAAVMRARSEAELSGLDTDGEAFWEQIMEVTGG